MPTKDRTVVLKELKRQVRKRRGKSGFNSVKVTNKAASNKSASSEVSVPNNWRNWVVLRGNEEVAVEDVWGIGKAIGVKFNGDKANMFNVLSNRGRRSGNGGGSSVGEGVLGKKDVQ
jgi:hypothetical protein